VRGIFARIERGDLLAYDGIGPFEPDHRAWQQTPDETSPPCVFCGEQTICADGICGSCGNPHGGRISTLSEPRGTTLPEPRHGTWNGYHVGCRCAACLSVPNAYHKKQKKTRRGE
jgi:hypothetical protein